MSNPFDQFDAKPAATAAPAANPFDQFDPEPAQDNALVRGFKKSKQSVGLTASLAAGDAADTAKKVAEADSYAKANPGTKEGAELMDAWNKGDGVIGGVKGVAGEIAKDWNEAPTVVGGFRSLAKNAAAMGSGIVEQVPNMIAPMAGMIAGGVAGGAAGSAVPVIGNAVGAAAGGFAGAALGNAAVEGGGMLQDELQKAGINPQDQAAVRDFVAKNGDRILGQAGVKGGIIGAVDTATAGLGHWLLTGPGKAAAGRALTSMGVDLADKAAVEAASKSPEFAAKVASDAAYKAQTTGAQGLARNVGAAAMEPAGEFAGEYVGQGAATGDWDTKNAALEAFSSVGQSGAMFAGQKAIQYATNPLGFKAGGATSEAGTPAADGAAPTQDSNELALAPLDQQPADSSGGKDALEAYPGGKSAIQTTFDPRNPQSQPPMALMPKADESGIPYEPTGFTPRRPSEAMGLDPNAGTLSAAAVVAVDSGASPVAPAAAPAAPAAPAPTLTSAAGKAAGFAPGGATAQAATEAPDLSGWSEDDLRAQLRSAQGKGVRLAIAQELGRRREAAAGAKSDAAAPAASPAPAGDWQAFPPESGTLGVPRAEMPQVKAEHRGPMVNFLKARGIDAEQAEVPASSLKPTQAEYSAEKVAKALGFTGSDRSILVSSDGHVLDGHHQWLAKAQASEPVKVIRLDAPIKDLLSAVKDFPSSTVDTSSATATTAPAADPAPAAGGTSKLAAALAAVRDQKKAQADQAAQASQAAAPAAAPAEPAADIRTITAKQIPDMTDAEIRQAIAHYGPDHKRTAKLQRALESRGVTTTETTQDAKNEPSTTQAQQAEAQGPQAPAAPRKLSPEHQARIDAVVAGYEAAGHPEMGNMVRVAAHDRPMTDQDVAFQENHLKNRVAEWNLIEGSKTGKNAPVEPQGRTEADLFTDTSREQASAAHVPAAVTDAVLKKANEYVKQAADKGVHLHQIDSRFPPEIRGIKDKESALRGTFLRYANLLKAVERGYKRASDDKLGETEAELSDMLGIDVKALRQADDSASSQDAAAAPAAGEAQADAPTPPAKPGLKKKADAMRAKADRMEAAGGDAGQIKALRDQAERDDPTPAAPAAPAEDATPQGKVGQKLAGGDVVLTNTGRKTEPFPKVDLSNNRKAINTAIRIDRWLIAEALAEAEARGDNFNANQFRAINNLNPSQADRDAAEEYLFGDYIPPVIPSILKPLVPAAPSAEALAAQAAEMKRAAKEVERELFRSLASRADLIGKDVAEVAKAVQDAVDTGNQKTAINGLQVARLARAIHKQLVKAAREIERNKHRDPEVYAAAVSGAAADVGIEDPAQVEVFKAGWAHALAGKTKSTLSGEGLADMLRGYEAASAWRETEEGAAWYEGRPSNKLKNTGVDLRRHWEAMKAAMKAGESDTAKAWSQIERATERAALLAPLLPKDAKPGFVKYFTELRSSIRTFKQWLQEKSWDYSVAQVRGSDFVKFVLNNELAPQALDKEDQAEYRQSEEFRIKWLQDQAADYIRRVSDLTGFMAGATSVKEAAEKFDAAYMDGTLLNPAGRQAASRFAEGSIWEAHTNDFAKFRSNSNWTEHLIDREDTLALPNRANPLTPPKLDRVERTGLPDYRKGENITPEQFKKAFGFADVGFGNWVGAKQDQDHLNYAYDALMDLAQKMGMDPKNVGFGGRLHFTIGALGHGKFAAHFSPNHPGPSGPVQVINLTNTKGDGTVFHEWTHALDHFLGGDWKGTVRNRLVTALSHKMLTVEGVNTTARRFLNGSAYWKGNKRGDRVHAAIQGINYYVGSRNPQTAYKTNADALGKDYWGNEHELIARAAEAWASDTLAGKNDYLVNSAWVGDGAVTAAKGYRGSPYPAGDERKTFAKLFDALAKSIKWQDGLPTITRADFDAAIPEDLKAGEKRRLELQAVEAMEAYRDELLAADAEMDANRQADAAAKAAAEREEMDRIAAEKLAELQAATAAVDEAKPDQTTGPLSDDDLSALFDQAAAELREEAQEKPDTPAPGLDESSLPELTHADGVPTLADAQELHRLVSGGAQLIFSGSRWAGRNELPTVQSVKDMTNDGQSTVDHMGFGMFRLSGRDLTGTYSAGGAMNALPGGTSYSQFSPSKGEWSDYPKARVLQALEQAGAKPAAAPAAPAKAPAAAPAPKAEDKSAAKLIAEAAKLGVKGADEALRGLSALFGGPGRLNSFPGGFDEETYQKAKPHFEAALSAFQEAGKSLKDLFKLLINQFGDGVKEYAIRFAKDQNLTAQLGSAKTVSASGQVAQRVADRLAAGEAFDWRTLFAWSDEAFGGSQAEGKYTPKDAYDAMEAGVNQYMMREGGRAFTPNVEQELALSTVGALERMTALLPTQTKRTAEQDEFQQFSTVPALAFAANWVANITSADTMMEPSAGIGGLATFAKNAGAKLILNELSSRRAALLQEVFPASKVFTENAEQIHNILPASEVPSVVVMNPPFSATAGRMQGYRNTQVGGQHVEQALKRLAKGGRLVAIVGEGMAMDRPAFKDWWAKIGAEYDVRAAIPMDGSGYAKYGTTFDNAILVIDKVKPTGRPVVTTKATTYTELVSLLSEIRNDRPAANLPSNDFDGIERDSAESARLESVPASPSDANGLDNPGRTGDVGAGNTGGRPELGGRGDGKRGPGRAERAGGDVREPGGAGVDGRGEPGGRGDGASAAPGGSGAHEPGGLTVSAIEAKTGELTDSVFENYQPQRLQVPGAKPHPGPLVQSAAMASVLPPAPTYVPNLPAETISEGKLSIAQIESVVYAGQAHSEFLGAVGDEQPARRGFFIGDGTGVGKGREISGILLDNLRQGRTKAVWVSEKQGLMNDAKRDFGGVGGDAGLIFNQNKTKAEDQISAGDGIIFTTYSTLRSGAQSQDTGKGPTQAQLAKAYPAGTPAVVANSTADLEVVSFDLKKGIAKMRNRTHGGVGTIHFGRIQSIDGKADWMAAAAAPAPGAKTKKAAQSRLDQLVAWLGKDFDGVIAFDEAHNAGNAVSIKGERGASEPSAQALAVVELQKRLPKARVVYVSATGATQVSNLSYATRLGLWGPGTPFPSVHNFIAEMNAGGLAAMELVARDMKQMGAYIARSLSFDGVTYSRVEHELTPAQRDIYNRMAEAWQVTLRSIEKALEVTGATGEGGKGKSAAKSAAKSAYWGAQQRFFNQIITSMQMPTVLEQIERDLAAGDAVVLQLVNTNEAQQNRAVEKRKEEGESADLEDLDLTPRDMLIQMVEKSYPVVQYETVFDGDGKPQRVPVKDSEGNPVLNREAIEMRDQLIKDLQDIRVPDGPLEIIMNHFGPDKVAEVTGRTQRVVRKADDEGNIRAQLETRGASAARADADAFMADKKQILAFSDAGGTGFSFHADLTKENQRKRKHYLIQPGWRADKAVQGFGRTHRTNQKSAPHYYLASTDIPAQKRFLSAIARRLDQLGALTKGQRDTANQGLFSEKDNLESKYATQAVRQLIEDMKGGQALGLNFQEFLRQTGLEDIVDPETNQIAESKIPTTRLFLNRMLSLDLKMQDKVFDAFIDRMSEKIDVAIERGELDTGMQTIRALESKVLNDAVAYTDPRTNAETRLVDLELTQPTTMFRFPELASGITWVQNRKSGRVWGKSLRGQVTLKNGAVVDRFAMTGTSGTQTKDATEFAAGPDGQAPYIEISKDEARELWAAENAKRPATYTQKTHMVVGAMLPIWDRLKTSGTIRVARTQTADGQRLLGMVVDPKSIGDLRKRLNVDSGVSKLPPAEVMARILKGDQAELANGWHLERVRVSGDLRIEIKPKGYLTAPAARELTGMGAVHERISWTDRYFVPIGADGVKMLESMFQTKPVVDLVNPNDAGAEGATFSRVRPTFSRGAQRQANAHVQGVVDALTAKWENAPRIVVAFDMNDPAIPDAVRAEDARQRSGGATGTPEGFYYKGDVYLLSSKLNTNEDVARVLFHEALGHFGLRRVFGKALKPILQQVALFRRAEVDAKIKEYGLRGVNVKDRLLAAEEVLSEMAQTHPEIGFVQRAIAAIRTWLRENIPFLHDLAMSDDEIISNYLLPARGFVERSNDTMPQAALAFSRSAMKAIGANVARGQAAMNKVLLEKTSVHRAMYRNGLGWVDFEWGDGKKGVSHIISRRMANDGMSREAVERLLTTKVVEAIARGSEIRRNVFGKNTRLVLSLDGAEAVLVHRAGGNGWLLTAYEEKEPDAAPGGATRAVATRGAPIRSRGTPGAGASIIANAASGIKPPNTAGFARWFAGSKVIDDQGRPLVVYHGTTADVAEFSDEFFGEGNGSADWGDGFYFASNPAAANGYAAGEGGNVMPVYLAIKNPASKSVVLSSEVQDAADGYFDSMREVLEDMGYDGIVIDHGSDGKEYVAFRPDQIKSATGNNGEFDGENPGVVFSRSTVADMTKKASDQIALTLMHTPGKLSIWHKTLGTMYNLAERSPAFKRVFDAAQGFIDDVSYFASEAADLAPKLLPKLETWRDIGKSPVSAADNKAVSAPVFEGTLEWRRGEDGKPVRINELQKAAEALSADQKAQRLLRAGDITQQMLRAWRSLPMEQYEKVVSDRFESRLLSAGIVWTDAELKSMFKLNDAQIGLYKEFRAATDKSIDTLAKSDMLRLGGEEVQALREAVLDAADAREAAGLVADYLRGLAQVEPGRATQLMQTANSVIDRADQADRLKEAGYAPLSRFGRYTVDVVGEGGKRIYFGMYETAREANLASMQFKKGYPGAAVTQGTMSEEAYKLLAGVTPESLEMFGGMLGLSTTGDDAKDQVFQEYLRLTKNNRSALKHLIHRKGIDGYSTDVGRVLATFIYSNSRRAAGGVHLGDMTRALGDIPKEQGELKDAAVALSEYVQNPREEAQALRGLLFTQYLGGSIASAMVNMTQPLAVSLPYLSQFGGAKRAGAELLRAIKGMATSEKYEPALAEALSHAEEDGTVSPQEIHQLMAQARGAATLRAGDGTRTGEAIAASRNALSRLGLAWGKVFGAAEQVNRRSTYIAAFRLAVAQGMANPAAFAKKAVHETQFVYSKANKNVWGRGAIGGTLMTFKTYGIAYMELLSRMWGNGPEGKKAVLLALAVMFLLGGAGGLPFAEDLEDVADGIGQSLGYNFSSKKVRQEVLEDLFGQAMADFIDKGITGLPGVPIDVSGRLGMGNLLPGTGLLVHKSNHSGDLKELVGPAGDLVQRGFQAAGQALTGDLAGAALTAAPRAVSNATKGLDMLARGMYRDDKGYKVLDTSAGEGLAKLIGFQPADVAKIQEANYLHQRAKDLYNTRAQEIRAQWARGIFEKDQAMVDEARAAMADWNEKNPDQRIKPDMTAILKRVHQMAKSKDQRIADAAPKAMRAQMRKENAEIRQTL